MVNKEKIAIRPLSPSDSHAFQRWRGHDDYTSAIVAGHLSDHAAGRRCIFIAAVGDAIIGTAQLVRERPDPDLGNGRDIGYLEAVEIVPEYRRRGIAREMMRRIEAHAANLGVTRLTIEVEPDNIPAFGLYQDLGYREFRRGTWVWRGVSHPTICMAKTLADAEERQR